ncbi:monovalent cation/H+ antiporter complex subunit F [Candidatus Deianiraea vastatrix]|nr:monovalent cation/H+ antiporter complex subunit F [Candidatus Deianiraea vastatrix]
MIIKIVLSNASTTLIAGIIVLFGTLYDYPEYIDIAVIYALLGFAISTVLLFFVTSGKEKKSH